MTHAPRRPYGTSNEGNAAYELLVACTGAGPVTDVRLSVALTSGMCMCRSG